MKCCITCWFERPANEGQAPDVMANFSSVEEITIDDCLRHILDVCGRSYIDYATFSVQGPALPDGITVFRWGASLVDGVYSFQRACLVNGVSSLG